MKRSYLVSLCFLFCFLSCNKSQESDKESIINKYSKLLNEEKSSGQQCDTLFYGVHFKMTSGRFYDHCHEMFKKGVFNGNYNNEVIIALKDSGFKKEVEMKFYPFFDQPFVQVVNARFKYANTSVFDKKFSSNVLIKELQNVMEDWYGGHEFMKIPPDNVYERPTYVKIDGNRKITLKEGNALREVIAIYEDLNPLY